jgi:multidrug efflux pump subunit AcrA (membrane-fusion protein)
MTRRHRSALILSLVWLAGCQGNAPASPTAIAPTPTPVPVVTATGQVVPRTWADLSLSIGGIVDEIAVGEGQTVHAGDLLMRLADREPLEAALAAAQMEQVAARQSLDEVHEQLDVVRAAAQSELANAREAQRAAEYKWTVQQQGNRASDDTIKAARARLVVAQETMEHLKDVYDHTPGRSSEDAGKAEALSAYLGAQANRDSAQRALNWYVGKPTAIQQAMLDADVAVAKARVAAAERALQDLQQGPDPDTLAQAEARLRYAEAQVAAAQAALADSELRAPFGGTVAAVLTREREWISTGQAILSLADLAHLQVETTDLNEIDAARVEVGAPVSVTFDALPEVEVAGHVVQVAPKASAGSGVNYTVTVELAETPARLRWGMTAFVDIEVGGG